MKYLLPVALVLILASCGDAAKTDPTPSATPANPEQGAMTSEEPGKSHETASTLMTDFLDDYTSLTDSEEKQPIDAFSKAATAGATTSMELKKDNVKDVLAVAADYDHFVIVVEDHTIVTVKDVNNCQQSGSWGACMPHAEGYIKKGKLIHQSDFLNNIIGRPDSQKRTAYFFR